MGTEAQHDQATPMRQRLGQLRPRSMARRAAEDDRFTLTPRARRIVGWLAALLLVLGIAIVVNLLGGEGDGLPIGAGPSGSAAVGANVAPIAFGTEIDAGTAQVAEASRTESFAAEDTFAYSVAPGESVPDAVYVEVQRIGGGPEGAVQEPTDAQTLPDPRAIAFQVPAEDLLEVFGPGEYLMLIYAEPTGDPIAEGEFELIGDVTPPSGSPGG